MKTKKFLIYAGTAVVVAGLAIWYIIDDYYGRRGTGEMDRVQVVMYKNPGCQCCDRWAEYMERNGYAVTIKGVNNMPAIKQKYRVSRSMESCHTALVGGYVVEGHVPVMEVNRLLKEQPDAVGLAVPGMPASSPGMNTAFNQPFDVYQLQPDGDSRVVARY